MSTLPPEGQGEQPTGGQPTSIPPTGAPNEPPAAPKAPENPDPQAPPAQPQYDAPQPPPQYAPPVAPEHQAPPQQPGYQPPAGGQVPPGGYQQAGYQQPVADPVSNITLNYWLSVFFVWVPALIFYLIEKDKGNPQSYAFHRDNLNFSLVRTGLYVIIVIAGFIPYLNLILVPLIWIAQIVTFIFHIIAAAKAPEAYRRGEQPGFIFNIPFVK